MALKATIYKAALSIANMDRGYYADHELSLARHPSETEERMMVRLVAFSLYADASLAFAKGLCVDDEPELWLRDLTGAIECWIDVGQPDEKWIRKACGRARKVVVVSYGRAADIWWKGISAALARYANLDVVHLPVDAAPALAVLTGRSMRLQVTIQEGQLWVTDGERSVLVEPVLRMLGGVAQR
nr:YaeQ family protein [Zoogloeaceae bacterium]